MSPKSLLIAVTTAIVILTAADVTVRKMAANSVPRQVEHTILGAPSRIDYLGVGNSLVAAGMDPDSFEKVCESTGHPCTAINGGLGATGLIEHLALTKLALRGHSVETLVYGYFDHQLATDVAERNSDLIGNRAVLYSLEPDLTLKYARFGLADSLSFQLFRSTALLRERGATWAKVELLRRRLGSIGMTQEVNNRFGRAADFSLLEARDSDAFASACESILKSGRVIAEPMEELLREARDRGVKVVVVEMPVHPDHLKFYKAPVWNTYRAKTVAELQRAGATHVDASLWIDDQKLFEDHLHLSMLGAKTFSRQLAEYLQRL